MTTKIVIDIKGGTLWGVFSNQPIEYVLVDHDNIKAGDRELRIMEPDVIVSDKTMSTIYAGDIAEQLEALKF